MRRTLPFLVCIASFAVGWIAAVSLEQQLFAQDVSANDANEVIQPEERHQVLKPVLDDVRGEPTRPIAEEAPTGDWAQWGGDSARNNVPVASGIPDDWQVGELDSKTGEWDNTNAKHIKYVVDVGSQTYGNPVVAGGRLYVGSNNSRGYLPRYPGDIDLGCMLAFNSEDGKFLWQDSSEKLSTGRVHDWPLQGICCAPYVEGERMWYVSSRGEVVCCDTQGFYDGEDDGPVKGGLARLFKSAPLAHLGLDDTQLPVAIKAALEANGYPVGDRYRVEVEEEGVSWIVSLRRDRQKQYLRVKLDEGQLVISNEGIGKKLEDALGNKPDAKPLTMPSDLTSGLSAGKASATFKNLLAARGVTLPDDAKITADGPTKWSIAATLDGKPRQLVVRREGPNLSAYRLTTVDDKQEADRIWVYDMMKELGVSQHNMCSCSVTAFGDILFVNTSNGVDESHKNLPSPKAPSFMAIDKNTGKVYWTDASPSTNILHGQWSSPSIGMLGGVAQVIFAGGDGWVYSFKANKGKDGAPELLWKFDANPKETKWILNGNGTRNNIIATPVLYKDRVYVAVGQDPEHGPGEGHLWCIDPTKRGDISPQLAVYVNDRKKIVPPRRLQAIEDTEGEVAIDNPNSGALWHYEKFDQDGDGEFDVHETMNRSCGTVAIKDDILFIADFSGIFHCLDALTGKVHWTYDMFGCAWGSPIIVDNKVIIGDEDGEVAIFRFSKEPQEPYAEISMVNSVYSTPIIAHGVLYIANKTHVFAIEQDGL